MRAFTLLEVLIAIALVMVLGATMFTFLHDMLATRGRTLEVAMQQRAAATLIERMEADVAACLVGDARSGAGVQGDGTHLRLLTRGVLTQQASRGLDDPTALGDLQSVEYRFDAGQHHLEARKAAPGESPAFAPLGGTISHVQFRYLDGRQWKESFDSLALNRLPGAIEVRVWFNPWPSDVRENEVGTKDGDGRETGSGGGAAEREDFGNARAATRPGNFDDDAFAAASETETFRPPPPDRVRVMAIPDGGAEEGAASDE